ncbi:pyruvate kinase [Candidatus Rhodoblastus alkanivorans]|uniref:pyruvate kinase n=1 Tax=Candidatus Rhodoblastus alkanivorans TaxID=2954117 RepID=UPI0031452ADF
MSEALALFEEIERIRAQLRVDSARQFDKWRHWRIDPGFVASAENLAAYLALRHYDLRAVQRELMALGLSSLGRLESRALPTLDAVAAALAALAGRDRITGPDEADFFAGEHELLARSRALFGESSGERLTALMVTCPSSAAEDRGFFLGLAEKGVEAVRINCAHDDADKWARMVENVRFAGERTGRRMRIFMDLAGPKVRTGAFAALRKDKHAERDELVAVTAPGELKRVSKKDADFALECSLPEAIDASRPGDRLSIDDGKLEARIERVDEGFLIARVVGCEPDGYKFKSEKGLNFPDAELAIPALTAKDRDDLGFVAAHADAINFSFVQSVDDIESLQEALEDIRPGDWRSLPLVLKIETPRAVRHLPDLIVRAGARQPAAVMIARGDLAIEMGFTRLAEMQEEILWIAEAARVPVIWATQVMENLVKTGAFSRGEMTDAAMAARAECVMLNKGPHLMKALGELIRLLGRMDVHYHKKTPHLRRLASW